MSSINIQWLFYLLISFICTNAFIPIPLLATGGQTSESITHTEITELGFIRSLTRFFYDTRIHPNNNNNGTINEQEYFSTEHNIEDLYKIAHPEYSEIEIELYSLPLKFTLDYIIIHNGLVDFLSNTKKLSAAHFDSEAFLNGSRRILQLRQTIVANTRHTNKNLTETRELVGKLLHTLQDFYSHSNWIEMGKTDINNLIGINEIIGTVAKPNEPTCTNNGCTRIEKECSLWQLITLRSYCPLVYYDCKNNILPEINNKQILTSGYSVDQHNENNDPINKPTNVEKCSHGSIMDSSSHIPAIGGINKDANSSIFSPHSNFHFQAADLAIKATEKFFNDLRKDVGDDNFDRLLIIHPTLAQCQDASNMVAKGQRFRFFTPNLSTSLKKTDRHFANLRNVIKNRRNTIRWMITNNYSNKMNIPTYDLSDFRINVKDTNNLHTGPYFLANKGILLKKRLIDVLRQHRKMKKHF